MAQPVVIVVMGVSGSGKTTVGSMLAGALRWHFHDADDDHDAAAIEQMAQGRPLSEAMRLPWLKRLSQRVARWLNESRPTVLACSALTSKARQMLRGDDERVQFVYLRGEYEDILRRMHARSHFMPPALLQSQFDALEEPGDGVTLDIHHEPGELVEMIRGRLGV